MPFYSQMSLSATTRFLTTSAILTKMKQILKIRNKWFGPLTKTNSSLNEWIWKWNKTTFSGVQGVDLPTTLGRTLCQSDFIIRRSLQKYLIKRHLQDGKLGIRWHLLIPLSGKPGISDNGSVWFYSLQFCKMSNKYVLPHSTLFSLLYLTNACAMLVPIKLENGIRTYR